jgi:hypothetical protein
VGGAGWHVGRNCDGVSNVLTADDVSNVVTADDVSNVATADAPGLSPATARLVCVYM